MLLSVHAVWRSLLYATLTTLPMDMIVEYNCYEFGEDSAQRSTAFPPSKRVFLPLSPAPPGALRFPSKNTR